jgi:hypothetical protein
MRIKAFAVKLSLLLLSGIASSGAYADVLVAGDTPCPSGYSLLSPAEARENLAAACGAIGTWDIVRLAEGGSISGSGYGCAVFDDDWRPLGASLCQAPQVFTTTPGDGTCLYYGVSSVSYLNAKAHQAAACSVLGTWYVTRLGGGGSMSGPGYGCALFASDPRGMGASLCASFHYVEVPGDTSCTPGMRLITPDDARARSAQVCPLLGYWDIVRLAGTGSMSGPGYGCAVFDHDTRALGASLCTW